MLQDIKYEQQKYAYILFAPVVKCFEFIDFEFYYSY